MKFILGKKLGMTQLFDDHGKIIPVTLIKAGPCWVVQVKTEEKDGYRAVQIGFEKAKDKTVKKPQKSKPYRYLREFKTDQLKIGDKIDLDNFYSGEIVRVSGISKGKGFQGVVKRHGFKGSPASHGTKHTLRAPGSIGSAFPQRVFKGKKMAGRMGSDRVSIKGLEIAEVDKKDNILAIKGALPGRKGTLLEIIVVKEMTQEKPAVKEEKIEKKKEEKNES